jgi:type 1 glutamine amidotransferase
MGQSRPHPTKIRVLLLTGENNHDWKWTSKEIAGFLEDSGRFSVRVETHPASFLKKEKKNGGLAFFDVIFVDFNSAFSTKERWGDEAEANFLSALRGGKGVVLLHSANNSFPDWKEWAGLAGLVWRKKSGHGRFHSFTLDWRQPMHPILKGMPTMYKHPDELYHRLENPLGAKFEVLADALSSKKMGGTGETEPMVLIQRVGKGRVFHTTLGHVWPGVPRTRASLQDPLMRLLLARGTEWAATGEVRLSPKPALVWNPNRLSEEEKSQGFRLLFDGKSPDHWRGYRKKGFPKRGWFVEKGSLHHKKGQGGGDLISRKMFGDFELKLEWRIAPKGNSGIMYLVTEEEPAPWMTGPEMQVLDNAAYHGGKNTWTSAGALYALIPCAEDVSRPALAWNQVRILKKGEHIEHWLNGVKVLAYELSSKRVQGLIQRSKFGKMPKFAKAKRGFISLQDHGDEVWYRGLKIREFGGAASRKSR